MADYHTNSSFLFPLQPIRCQPKSAAERGHITEIRLQLFERSGGRCELQLGAQCWDWISWDTMHTAHIVSRARGGPWDLSNLQAACPACHAAQHNGGFKVCPPKTGGAL